MANHNELGKFGEQEAVAYLMSNDYEILNQNWTFDKAEIDIIARKGKVLAVVEVKTRSSLEFGLPQDFVKPKKIKLLMKAVNEYVTLYDLDLEIRFDIISVHIENGVTQIEHLEDAFYNFD
ncbi:YraN family protein [Flavobacterium sp.]|uniref:YraN family protein n=1 Tax=Flavobacterium sp. TaxID=239 RepID=UPI0025C1153C|nr:YraN family protein [Flavobacterium sp.]